MFHTVRRSPLARQIQAVVAITCLGLLAFLQLPSRAQEKNNQQSPKEQSVQRDQSYVRLLLQRGTSDAKVESFLILSSQFPSFNPSGDFHAYALKLIAQEKTALKQRKQTQQATVQPQSAPPIAVAETSPTVVSGNVAAPANLVGIGSMKASQETSPDSSQDTSSPSTPDNSQVTVSNPSPAAVGFGGAVFLPSAPFSSGSVSVPAIPVSAGSTPVVTASSGDSSAPESTSSATFNSDQGPGPGQSVQDQDATYFPPRPLSVRWSRSRTLDRHLPRPMRAWLGLFNC